MRRALVVTCTSLAACTIWSGVSLPSAAPGVDAGVDATVDAGGSAYAAAVRADAPIAYWRFRNAPVTDETGHGHTCTVNPPSILRDAGPFPDAWSAHFGAGDSVVCGKQDDPTFAFDADAPFTIEGFVALDGSSQTSTAEYRHLFDRMAGNDEKHRQGYYAYVRRNAGETSWELALETWHGNGPGDLDFVGAPFPVHLDGVFTHVAFVRDRSSLLTLYVDGAPVAQHQGTAGPAGTGVELVLGRNQTGSLSLDGSLAEVAIYDRALDGPTIKAHFDAK